VVTCHRLVIIVHVLRLGCPFLLIRAERPRQGVYTRPRWTSNRGKALVIRVQRLELENFASRLTRFFPWM